MNLHNLLLIVELLTMMLVHFELGQEWAGFYILAIVSFWSMLQLIQL